MKLEELKSRDNIGFVLNRMGLTGVGVEYGKNAEIILSASSLSKLVLVDAWRYIEGHDAMGFGTGYGNWDDIYSECVCRMEKFGDRSETGRK